MTSHLSEELDDELIRDFMGELSDAYQAVEQAVFALEHQPTEAGLLDDLFRTLHSVKSNLRMMHLGRYSDLVHTVENVLERARRGEIRYTPLLGDLFLLSVNEIRGLCHGSFGSGKINDPRCVALEAALAELAVADQFGLEAASRQVIHLLDPGFLDEQTETGEGHADLQLFSELAAKLQDRSPYWRERCTRLMELVLEINAEADSPVDEPQLQAAVYLHDMGMAFLPLDLLHSPDDLDGAELERLHKHPTLAASVLRQLGGWDEAATMVEQHHEWFGGGGYPNGLIGETIHPGARIIAIADTFESMTHERADREHKRSVLRAVAEINGMAGKQFDPQWVQVFNAVVRRRYVNRG